MKVIKGVELKRYYEEETEKARLIMIETIKEKDIVLSELQAQRVGVNKTVKYLDKKEISKNEILSLLNSLGEQLKYKQKNFYNLTDKQLLILKDLEVSISKYKYNIIDLDKELEDKEKIYLDLKIIKGEFKNIKQEVIRKTKEKEILINDMMKKTIEVENKYHNFYKEKDTFNIFVEEIKEKEQKLLKTEKRLLMLKKDLLSKK